MSPGRQESTETEVTTGQAIKTLAQLLARQAARDCVAASPSLTVLAPDSTDPDLILSPNDEGGRHDG